MGFESTLTTEQRIMQAAEHDFLTSGFAATKTTEIAARAGVTHAMLHYYFRTKENLFNRIVESKIELLSQSIQVLFKPSQLPLVERIQAGVEAHFDFLVANPELPRFVINEVINNPKHFELFAQKAHLAVDYLSHSNLLEEFDKCRAKGQISDVSPADLLFDIVSLNVFLFVALPIVDGRVTPLYGGREQFLEARKKENVRIVTERLLNNNRATRV